MADRADDLARGVCALDDGLEGRSRWTVEVDAGAVASAQTDGVVLARHRGVDLDRV